MLTEAVCTTCERTTYPPAFEPVPHCPDCGGELQVVDTFRDRRRVSAPVKRDRRK